MTSSPRTLIIFFGHRNAPDGTLTEIATARCERVVELTREHPQADVLISAGHGAHFNDAARPHWQYLRDDLVARGVAPGRILSGSDTTNTAEEALWARRVFLIGGYARAFGVTSSFHAERVRFILGRVMPDVDVEVVEATVPAATEADLRREARSFAAYRRTWTYPPLFAPGRPFPRIVYVEAAGRRAHYELTSLMVLAVCAALTLLALAVGSWTSLAAAVVDACGWLLFERTTRLAAGAQQFMRTLEIGFALRGFSSGHNQLQMLGRLPGMRTIGRFLFAGLGLALAGDLVTRLLQPAGA